LNLIEPSLCFSTLPVFLSPVNLLGTNTFLPTAPSEVPPTKTSYFDSKLSTQSLKAGVNVLLLLPTGGNKLVLLLDGYHSFGFSKAK